MLRWFRILWNVKIRYSLGKCLFTFPVKFMEKLTIGNSIGNSFEIFEFQMVLQYGYSKLW